MRKSDRDKPQRATTVAGAKHCISSCQHRMRLLRSHTEQEHPRQRHLWTVSALGNLSRLTCLLIRQQLAVDT